MSEPRLASRSLVEIAARTSSEINEEEWCVRIGAVLRKRKSEINLSNDDLARESGMHPSQILSLLDGDATIEAESLLRIMNLLKINSPEELFTMARNIVPLETGDIATEVGRLIDRARETGSI